MVYLKIRHHHLDAYRKAVERVDTHRASRFLRGYVDQINHILSIAYDPTPVIGCWNCAHLDHKHFQCRHRPPLDMKDKFWFKAYGILNSTHVSQAIKDNFMIQLKDNIHLDNLTGILKRHFEDGEPLNHVLDVSEPPLTLATINFNRPQTRGPRYPCFFGNCGHSLSQYGYIVHLTESHELEAKDFNTPAYLDFEHLEYYFHEVISDGWTNIALVIKRYNQNFAVCFDMDRDNMYFYVVALFPQTGSDEIFKFRMTTFKFAPIYPETSWTERFTDFVYPIGTKHHNKQRGAYRVEKDLYSNVDLQGISLWIDIFPHEE